MRFVCRMVVLGACVLGLISPAQAQKIRDQFIKPMPPLTLMDAAAFEAQSRLVDNDSENDPPLAYQIRVPLDWVDGPDMRGIDVSQTNILGEIGKFFGPAGMEERSRIEIHAIGLDYQTTVEQWFLQYLIARGYNTQGMKVYDERCAEALYVVVDGAQSYNVRSVACINGKRVIFVSYYVPLERWEDEKSMQAQVLNSFRLKKIVREYVEPMAKEQLLDIVTIYYPQSWKSNRFPIRSIERIKLQLFNIVSVPDKSDIKPRLDGKMDVHMVSVLSAEPFEKEIEMNMKALSEGGLTIHEQIEAPENFVINPRIEFADTHVYRAGDSSRKLIDYELWHTAVLAGEYYYFVSLLTPGRDQDYALWARNTQTYKLVLDTLKPMPQGTPGKKTSQELAPKAETQAE